jgi:hypothetical protein
MELHVFARRGNHIARFAASFEFSEIDSFLLAILSGVRNNTG